MDNCPICLINIIEGKVSITFNDTLARLAAVGFEPKTLGFLRLGSYSLYHQCGHPLRHRWGPGKKDKSIASIISIVINIILASNLNYLIN